jgi:hypothetical protein
MQVPLNPFPALQAELIYLQLFSDGEMMPVILGSFLGGFAPFLASWIAS